MVGHHHRDRGLGSLALFDSRLEVGLLFGHQVLEAAFCGFSQGKTMGKLWEDHGKTMVNHCKPW